MAGKLFANHKVGDLWVEPWPVDDPTGRPHFDTVAITKVQHTIPITAG